MTTNYIGAQCPRCFMPLGYTDLRTGSVECPSCRRPFEATLFNPPERRYERVEAVVATPDGVANSCGTHPRNAAVTSCERCGLFICALCDMNIGEGSLCPPCFDRARAEGSLKGAAMRYRDYATAARAAAIVGFLVSFMFLGTPFGVFAIFYAIKGMKQRRQEGSSVAGMIVVMIFGILEVFSPAIWIAILMAVAQ